MNAITKTKGVRTTHKGYDTYSSKWKRCRDAVAGQDAMHSAKTAYLPKLVDENETSYSARIKRSNFFNGTWRTIAVLLGMMFRKPANLEVPAGIEDYLDDVTMSGTTFPSFAREVAGEVLEVGRVGILVDHPAPPENVQAITVAAAQELGLRPTMQIYHAESILNWKHRNVRNRNVLSMVVLKECASVDEGEFEVRELDRYRVLDLDAADLYRVRLFEVVDGKDVQIGADYYPLMNGNPLGYIPFAIVGVDGVDSSLDEPPLIDLVDANIAHYQINSDYRHGLHFTGLPTLFLAGVQMEEGQKFHVGSTAAIASSDPNAKGSFIEFTGQGLSETREALKEIKQEMAMLGARAIADETTQAETLGGTAIKRSGENSILSSIAIAVSEALEWALGIFAQWAGQSGTVEYQINRDFLPTLLDAQQLTALMGAVQAGELSSQSFFELLQRGDVVDAELTYEDERARIEAGGPPAPVVPGVAA